ncbi:MAG: hypothetical protein GY758_06125 [Fuerstiella sp.]|jgi:hypothetical protein|nr:hypothetical protein [Fuerstiella sp.]MCP4506872.1 hypothetical protein [Fuerstiella sp.]MDG2126814.1 hypothetical protein [Fuerstiella sp.]
MSVSEIGPEESAAAPEAELAETCLRCHTSQEWGESSWCPVCGYYPIVDGAAVDGKSWADDLPDAPEEVEEEKSTLQSLPLWFWGLLGGIVGITMFSVAIRVLFSDQEGVRGIIALTQLVIGFVSLLTAHGLAAKFAMKKDRRVNLNDVLLSWFNVWQPNILALPATYSRIWAVVWGGFAVLTAMTIIGGIDYSAPFRVDDPQKVRGPKAAAAVGTITSAAKEAGKEDARLDKALNDLQEEESEDEGPSKGGSDAMGEAISEFDGVEDQLEAIGDEILTETAAAREATIELECFVYGVVTDSKNVPVSFLFAADVSGRSRHVAEIRVEQLPPAKFRQMAVRLHSAVQQHPEVPSQRKAVWVKPIVTCRLRSRGYTNSGHLKKPEFDAIIVAQ